MHRSGHGELGAAYTAGLLALRRRIEDAQIPASALDESINFAIWNIRELGKKPRTEAAIHYIAEILGQFDLIALVELRDNLCDLAKILPILGPSWQVIYSDWTDDDGGNQERTAFLYDTRAVTFNGLAAEIDAPREKDATEWLNKKSFWRAPYLCSFRAGNFDFLALATHARWGDSDLGRQNELQLLADWIKTRFAKKAVEDRDLIVAGDFNIPTLDDAFFKALTSGGLQIPEALKELRCGSKIVGGSNQGKNARYDQILHLPTKTKRFTNHAGILDFYGDGAAIEELFPGAGLTKTTFTYQLSEHCPVWIQIKTDIDGERFDQIVQNGKK